MVNPWDSVQQQNAETLDEATIYSEMSREADYNSKAGRTVEEIYAERTRVSGRDGHGEGARPRRPRVVVRPESDAGAARTGPIVRVGRDGRGEGGAAPRAPGG